MNKNDALPKFWTKEDVEEAVRAADNKSYAFLSRIAIRVLKRMKKGGEGRAIAIISGSITNGGTLPGSEVKKNLERFEEIIQRLELQGKLVFNQLPFEEYLFQIRRTRPPEDPNVLLEEFYRPIFESFIINIDYFLPGWKESHGARWEYNLVRDLGMLYHFVRA